MGSPKHNYQALKNLLYWVSSSLVLLFHQNRLLMRKKKEGNSKVLSNIWIFSFIKQTLGLLEVRLFVAVRESWNSRTLWLSHVTSEYSHEKSHTGWGSPATQSIPSVLYIEHYFLLFSLPLSWYNGIKQGNDIIMQWYLM